MCLVPCAAARARRHGHVGRGAGGGAHARRGAARRAPRHGRGTAWPRRPHAQRSLPPPTRRAGGRGGRCTAGQNDMLSSPRQPGRPLRCPPGGPGLCIPPARPTHRVEAPHEERAPRHGVTRDRLPRQFAAMGGQGRVGSPGGDGNKAGAGPRGRTAKGRAATARCSAPGTHPRAPPAAEPNCGPPAGRHTLPDLGLSSRRRRHGRPARHGTVHGLLGVGAAGARCDR